MLNLIQNLSYRQKETDPVRQLADRQMTLSPTPYQNYTMPGGKIMSYHKGWDINQVIFFFFLRIAIKENKKISEARLI